MEQQDITITIRTPDGVTIAQAINLFAQKHRYQSMVPDGIGGQMANPETKAQFCKRMIALYVSRAVNEEKEKVASVAAAQAEKTTAIIVE